MIDLDEVFDLLKHVARDRTLVTYTQLSERYRDRKGVWHEPHGTWDRPLGEINLRLQKRHLPPLSAVVVLGGEMEPGGGFWGFAGVPPRPRDSLQRRQVHSEILNQVYASRKWPSRLPPPSSP